MDAAETHIREGKYDEALECLQQLLDDRTEEFGPTDESTLEVRTKIASVLVQQQKYAEALRELFRVYKIKIRTKGNEDSSTLDTRNYIVDLLRAHGTRDITSQILPEVESVVRTQIKIVRKIYLSGKYKETLDAAFEIWEDIEAFFGENCLHVQKLGLLIASAFSEREEFDESLKVIQDIYVQRRLMFGHYDRRIATVLMKKASVLHKKCDFEEALRLYCEVHEIRKDILGLTHRKTLLSLLHIARVTADVGNHAQALQIMNEVSKLQTRGNYKESLLTTISIGLSYFAQREYERALEIFNEASRFERVPRHVNAMIQNNIGKLLAKLGRFSEAKLVLKNVIKMRKSTHFHMETLSTYRDIAMILAKDGMYTTSCSLLKTLITASARLSHPLNSIPISIQSDLAMLYFSRAQYRETMYILSKILDLQVNHLGPFHPTTLNTKFNVAKVQRRQGRPDEALTKYNDVRNQLYAIFYPEHPDILSMEIEIGETYVDRHSYVEALEILYENYEKRVKIYGLDHPYTRKVDQLMTSFVGEMSMPRLMMATVFENLHDVRTYLEQGDNVNGRDVNGSTALHYASRDGYIRVLRHLLSKGAVYNIKDINGRTPESFVEDEATMGVFQLVQSLFEKVKMNKLEEVKRILQEEPSLVNARDELRRTPLQWAVARGSLRMTEELINRGADITLANRDDGSVLHTAARRGESEILALLLRHSSRGNPEKFTAFLNDKSNIMGFSPLHLAAKESYLACVNLLIEYKANPMIYDMLGKVAFDYAIDEECNFAILMYAFSHLNIYHRRV